MTDSHILALAKSGAIRVAVLGVFTALTVAACGGGGSGDTGTGGTANGTGGTANGTGGTANGTGGTANGTGGTANGSGGDSGGDGGAGNTGGLGGFGGETGNDEDCPATMPEADSECTVEGFPRPTCTYGDQECECTFGQDPVWECGEAQETEDCPTETPVDGEACTPGAGLCDMCFCLNDEWNCI